MADKKKVEEDNISKDVSLRQEQINYMIIKAKEEVNDALKVLFAKDSKLHSLSLNTHTPKEQGGKDHAPHE